MSSPGGPARVFVAVYALMAIAAGARSSVQIAARLPDAPLAYVLSAAPAAVYLVAAAGFAGPGRRVALAALSVELAGVLAIGTASLAWPDAFPDETVWSAYGQGYAFQPLVLPIAGLAWLLAGRAPSEAVTR